MGDVKTPTPERVKLVRDAVEERGIVEAAKLLSIEVETVKRYLRKWNYEVVLTSKPQILLFDIETAPMNLEVWSLWQKYNHIQQITDDWYTLTWRGKWLYSDEVFGSVLTPEESLMRDDSRIIKDLWDKVDQADIIIAYNLKKFDRGKMNAKFLEYKLPPPSSYQMIDPYEILRRECKQGFSSLKLDYVCYKLGIGKKIDTDYDLWKRCVGKPVATEIRGYESERDEPVFTKTFDYDYCEIENALQDMYDYCEHDVELLEELYLWIRPYIKSHPNLATYYPMGKMRCHACASLRVNWTGKYYPTPVNKYKLYRCKDCGSLSQRRSSELVGVDKENLLKSTAR